MDIPTRCASASDLPALRAIWDEAFGDEAGFFDFFFEPSLCIVADDAGSPGAAGYLVPCGDYVAGSQRSACAMIYGVAASSASRNRGLGAAVVRGLISAAGGRGFPSVVLCPSGDSLFEYYSKRSDMRDCFMVRERRFPPGAMEDGHTPLSRVSPSEYLSIRESVLEGIPHIASTTGILDYQAYLCGSSASAGSGSSAGSAASSGSGSGSGSGASAGLGSSPTDRGGLFTADTPGGPACLIVELQDDGSVRINELLAPHGCEHGIVAAVANTYPSFEYIVRSPVVDAQDLHQARRFGMLAAMQVRGGDPAPGGSAHSSVPGGGIAGSGVLTPGVSALPAPWYGPALD